MDFLCSPFRSGGGDGVGLAKAAYPKGKALANAAPNYAPDSNSLGKLAYYCEMNPAQLSKVAQVLLKSAKADARTAGKDPKAKARLCITLAILKKLIVDCKAHLSFFAREAVEIIELAIGVREAASPTAGAGDARRDIEIAERAASTFHAFATYAEQTSVGIDAFITGHYLSILAQFGSLAKEPYTNDSSVPGFRVVGLHAIDGAVSSDILFTAHFEDQARHILPTLLYNVLPTQNMPLDELRKLSREDTENKEFGHSIQKRRPLLERKARSIRSGKGDEKEISERDVATTAIKILRELFGAGHNAQLSASVEASVNWLTARENGTFWQNKEWCCWLADSLALWTHLQYRFVILGSLLDALSAKIDEPSVTAQQTSLIAMLTTILKSETSLVGLGIGDVLAQILGLITRRARISSQDALLAPLAECTAALASHVYYTDQVNDMVQDITNAITTLQNGEGGDSPEQTSGATRAAVRSHVQCLYLVLRTSQGARDVFGAITEAPKKEGKDERIEDTSAPIIRVANTGKRSPITPGTFQETLFLMVDADTNTRLTYLQALLLFVKNEMPEAQLDGLGREALLRFFHALHAYGYELATSHHLGLGNSRPTSVRQSSTPRKTSVANSIAEGATGNTASPADFALLRDVLVTVHSVQSSEAAIAGLPMLFTLESSAPGNWSSEADAARRHATLEVARVVFVSAGQTWGAKVAAPPASSVLPAKVSSDLTMNDNYHFGAPATPTKAPRLSATPDAFAASSALQRASGLTESELSAGLAGIWSAESAMQRSGRNNTPYAQGTLRIISTTSVAALNHQQDGSPGGRSLRAPSVADLKATLGDTPSSPTSPKGAPSIKSHAVSEAYTDVTSSSPQLHRRRSSRVPKHEALAMLDKASTAASPIKSNRLSVVAPPYA